MQDLTLKILSAQIELSWARGGGDDHFDSALQLMGSPDACVWALLAVMLLLLTAEAKPDEDSEIDIGFTANGLMLFCTKELQDYQLGSSLRPYRRICSNLRSGLLS